MWLQAGVSAVFLLLAQSCSDFASTTASGKFKMSARNFDHPSSLDVRLRGIKAGSRVSLLQLCPNCTAQTLQTKYDIVGFTAVLDYQFGFIDGINSEGLGVGGLMDFGISPFADWDPAGPPTAIPYTFATGYILANFKTVAEVQAAVTTNKVQFTKAYIGSKAFPTFPLHLSIHDALGNNVVLEIAEKGEVNATNVSGTPYTIYPNPLKTLTNSPNLPYQTQMYNYFVSSPNLAPTYINPYLQQQFGNLYQNATAAFVNVPGDYSSPSRRIRLALWREFQAQGSLPNHVTYEFGKVPMSTEAWSPNYGDNEWWSSFALAANGILHATQIFGYSDQGLKLDPDTTMNVKWDYQTTIGLDATVISIIRDHTTRQIFWWSMRAQRWQSYNLKTMAQSFLSCVTPLPVVTTAVYDRTPTLNNVPSKGTFGVAIAATGGVAASVCTTPGCPATLSQAQGIGIRCKCNGAFAVNDANGCGAPLTPAQVQAFVDAIVGGKPFPTPAKSTVGSLTVEVTDCKSLTAQQCCNAFGNAVFNGLTPLPSGTPISCVLSNGGTLAAQLNN